MMFVPKGPALWNAVCFLLIVLRWTSSQMAGQESPRAGNKEERTTAKDLRERIDLRKKKIRSSQEILRASEGVRKALQEALTNAEEIRKFTQGSLVKERKNPGPDGDSLETAEDKASVAEAEDQAAKKRLVAAVSDVEANAALVEEDQAALAVDLAELKTVEEPGREGRRELQVASKRYALAHLRAARAAQRVAENQLEAAEADLGVARKKLAIAKRRVAKAKNALERANTKDGPPRLGYLLFDQALRIETH